VCSSRIGEPEEKESVTAILSYSTAAGQSGREVCDLCASAKLVQLSLEQEVPCSRPSPSRLESSIQGVGGREPPSSNLVDSNASLARQLVPT